MTLYITDLDGTLLDSKGRLKARAAHMLNRFTKKGVMFTYATARGYDTSRRLTPKLELRLPLILMNGVLIAEPSTGKIIERATFSERSTEIANVFLPTVMHDLLVYAFIDGEERVSYIKDAHKGIASYCAERKGDKRLRECDSIAEMFLGDVYYFTLINPLADFDRLDEVFCKENGFGSHYYEDVYNKGQFWYEIFPHGVSKASAVARLKEITGADKVVVFGDNKNDIPMFRVADEGYAVANAYPELKELATGIIKSNNAMGVPLFIENACTELFEYQSQKGKAVDTVRFDNAILQANESIKSGIGTLNEKHIHRTLKYYFSNEYNHEGSVGPYFADIIGENGIIEIQSRSFFKLQEKLAVFLDVCHVTVMYPLERRTKYKAIDPDTGELVTTSQKSARSLSAFFNELYGIKQFLTDKNLTICIAELEVDRVLVSGKNKKRKYEKIPRRLLGEIYLESASDYQQFLPADLPKQFTKKDFAMHSKLGTDGVILEILEYVGVIEQCGKKGNATLYSNST